MPGRSWRCRESIMRSWLLWTCLSASCWLLASGKWVEGHLDTKENWAFLARFCFLSLDGQFEYSIEFDRTVVGTPNLLLYYDDESQWPSVYHSDKTCKEREAVLNKVGQNQVIPLSHWYPDTEFSGCVLRSADRELPATKTSTTTVKPALNITKPPDTLNASKRPTEDPSYYHRFLKTNTGPTSTTENANVTWFEARTTVDDNETTTEYPEESLWENISPQGNGSEMSNDLKDVELLFGNTDDGNHHKIKRSFEISERMKRRRLSTSGGGGGAEQTSAAVGKLVVSCHNARRFRSARERWWFIAISNCDSPNGLDIQYKFLMTNGMEGDFWHEHFSADEFYVLPVLVAYTLAYLLMLIAVAVCSVELKSRHLLHTTYKLFVLSVATQHAGVIFMSLAYARYAINGVGNEAAKIVGQFLCGVSEMTFLLVLVLMAKGYTITRARLKLSFTVKLTVFMCCYNITYVLLFVYQAKSFDPGAVLYLYESPAGYGLVVLRILAWFMFVYATVFTVKKYPEKSTFYCPFTICGSLWFYAGPLFILTANSYVDKWVRESVVTAVLLLISFTGHISFLLLTLPVYANKNFPYHVRTTQIGIMEVAGNGTDAFGGGMYRPTEVAQAQTVIIPLTRRTEELIGSMYSQYMASAPPLSLEDENKVNGGPLAIPTNSPRTLVQQDSTDTNSSVDIRATTNNSGGAKATNGTISDNLGNVKTTNGTAINGLPLKSSNDIGKTLVNGSHKDAANGQPNGVFSVESQMEKLKKEGKEITLQNGHGFLDTSSANDSSLDSSPHRSDFDQKFVMNVNNPILMSANVKPRKNLLAPLVRRDAPPPPSWSLAKGPAAKSAGKEEKDGHRGTAPESGFQAPRGPTSQRSAGRQLSDISTIHEQFEQAAGPAASTLDLFAAGQRK